MWWPFPFDLYETELFTCIRNTFLFFHWFMLISIFIQRIMRSAHVTHFFRYRHLWISSSSPSANSRRIQWNKKQKHNFMFINQLINLLRLLLLGMFPVHRPSSSTQHGRMVNEKQNACNPYAYFVYWIWTVCVILGSITIYHWKSLYVWFVVRKDKENNNKERRTKVKKKSEKPGQLGSVHEYACIKCMAKNEKWNFPFLCKM